MLTRGMTFEIFERIVEAVIATESSGNPKAESPAGAKGLMQLMDETGYDMLEELGFSVGAYDPFNPKQNRLLGSAYLRDLLKLFGEVKLALSAYNYGPGNISKLLREYGEFYSTIEPNLPLETKNYVAKISNRLVSEGIIV